MNATYTAVVKQDNGWWLGWIEEVPGVNCQEKTREKLIETLKLTLREALEFNRNEAKDAAGVDYEEELIAVSSASVPLLVKKDFFNLPGVI